MTDSAEFTAALERLPKRRPLPERVTIRSEWVRCAKKSCKSCPHGPYYYSYWKQDGKLQKRYIGKSWDEYDARKLSGRRNANGRRSLKRFASLLDMLRE